MSGMTRPALKIVHALHNYHPARGGAENLMKGVSDGLAKRGHDVRVVATNAYSTEDYFLPGRGKNLMPAGTEKIDGVAVTRVPFRRFGARLLNAARGAANRVPVPGGDYWRMLSWGPRSRAYRRAVASAAREADLVTACPLPTLNVWHARRAARAWGRPFVVVPCFHTEDRLTFHNARYFRWLREADAVVCLTEWEREYLGAKAGVLSARLHVIGAGIETRPRPDDDEAAARDAVRRALGLDGRELVLFLGQHSRHKGILALVSAMHLTWKGGRKADLVIAGNPTAFTAEVEREVGRLPESQRRRVRLVKGVDEDEKRRLLRAADVFVSVSPFESFGIVFLEAWRERRAVIGCRRGATSKLIDEFRDGLLVREDDGLELAGALLELLDDPELRRRMGERGFAKVRERYDWTRTIDDWESLYHDLVQRRRTAR
jgi:glycosyltransferase involved in cell wall biosynthesis